MMNSKSSQEPILQPCGFVDYNYGQTKRLFEGYWDLLLCYDDKHFDTLLKDLHDRGEIRKRIDNVALLKDSRVVIAGGFGIGAPAVVARCEELIACGVKRIISLGTAATISSGILIGDVIICEKAYSDEGTSRHYFPARRVFSATPELAHDICACLNGKATSCKRGAAWTTDAPYRETPDKRDAILSKGASVVEMETSALYMLGAYRNVEVLSVFVVGDSIAGRKWKAHYNDKAIKHALRKTGRALMAFLQGKRS